jgi:hypothetical protein
LARRISLRANGIAGIICCPSTPKGTLFPLGGLLRDSAYRGTLTYDAVFGLAAGALGDDPDGRRARFIELVRAAKKLAEKTVTAE